MSFIQGQYNQQVIEPGLAPGVSDSNACEPPIARKENESTVLSNHIMALNPAGSSLGPCFPF